jgi:2-succinyl-5-enolpyruvyl-6-hydroxy-3-cyclohexene-1-carboxylate synthase
VSRAQSPEGTSVDNAEFAAALVGALAAGGVRDAVVSPGSRSTPLALALAARADLRVHVLVDERAAGFVALGLARASGAPVALLATSGSAGAHWLPALVEAALSCVPLVAITANRPDDLQGCGAPQTIEQRGLFGPHVRWSAQVGPPRAGGPAGWPAAVAARAVDKAKGPPAGPVHLDVPFREPLWSPGLPTPAPRVAPRVLRAAPAVDARLAAEVAALLDAPRGVIVAGPRAVASADDAGRVLRLARARGWPVLADPVSGLRGLDDPTLVLAADALLRQPAPELRPDVVLRLGQPPTSKATTTWLEACGATTVLVDEAGDWQDPTHSAALLAVAPAGLLCDALGGQEQARDFGGAGKGFRSDSRAEGQGSHGGTPAATPKSRGDVWLAAWRAADDAAQAVLAAAAKDGLWEGSVARAVVEALPAGAALHVASSLAIREVDAFGGAAAPGVRVTSNRGCNGIEGTLATAAGAALHRGPVVALLGDLAFVHDLDGLAAAHELDLPLVAVVVDNGGGAIFQQLSVAAHPAFERLFLTPSRLDLDAAAVGLGARVLVARDLATLRAALREALETPDVERRARSARSEARSVRTVIRAVVDRAEGARRRAEAFTRASTRATSAARAALEPQEAPCPATSP